MTFLPLTPADPGLSDAKVDDVNSQRWQHIMEWPLVGAAVIFLAAYSWQVIGQPVGRSADIAYGAVVVSWLVFIVDYAVNLVLAQKRWHWFAHHLFDLLVIVLPLLRPLRVLRAITVLHVLNRTIGTAVRGRILIYTASASALLVYAASLAVLDAERVTDSAINTMGDAIWWAFVTVTTVGYGDMTPVTGVRRTLAVCLMLGGIALLGVVTGTLASWIVEKVSTDADENQAATVAHVRSLENRIAELTRTIGSLAPAPHGEGAGERDLSSAADARVGGEPNTSRDRRHSSIPSQKTRS